MKIDEVFELMKSNEKVFFVDNWGERELSPITGLDKDGLGTYRVYDHCGNDCSLDSVERVMQDKFRDVTVIIKEVYNTENVVIRDCILQALGEESISYKDLTIKE